jgi:hypothetical protein
MTLSQKDMVASPDAVVMDFAGGRMAMIVPMVMGMPVIMPMLMIMRMTVRMPVGMQCMVVRHEPSLARYPRKVC